MNAFREGEKTNVAGAAPAAGATWGGPGPGAGPRGGPTKNQVLGALRPPVGKTIGLTTRFSASYPINIVSDNIEGGPRRGAADSFSQLEEHPYS